MPIDDPFAESTPTINDPFKDIVDPFAGGASEKKKSRATGYARQVAEAIGEGPVEIEAKQPRSVLEQYKQLGKGLGVGIPSSVLALGDIPALAETAGRAGLRAAGAKISPEPAYTSERIGTALFGPPKSEYEAAARYAGTLATPFLVGKGVQGVRSLGAPTDLETALTRARTQAGEVTTEAQKRAEAEAAKAVVERAKRERAIGGQIRKTEGEIKPVSELEMAARSEAKLPAPEGAVELSTGRDLNSTIRRIAEDRLKQAETVQASKGGGAFENYRRVATEKQAAEPFGASAPGQSLKTELDDIIKGGPGKLREFGQAEIDIAKRIRNELYGKPASEIAEAEIIAKANQNPNRSMSMPAKMMQARNDLAAAEASGRKPVDFQVVDDLIRELRQKQSTKSAEGFTQVERERLGSAADRIENSLKTWVGEEAYPRAAYAEASKDLNQFRTKLGEALTAREEVKYATEAGVPTTRTSRLADLVFEGRENTRLAKQLLGEAEVNALGDKFAANQLAGKDASAVTKWMNDPKNSFIYEVPGLEGRIGKYAESLARREGDVKALEALRKNLGKDIETVRGVEKATKEKVFKTQQQINKLTENLQRLDPAKINAKYIDEIRPALEQTGYFRPEELSALGAEIQKVSNIANASERAEAVKTAVGFALKKLVTLGMGR